MIKYVVTINSFENRNDVVYYNVCIDDQKSIKVLYRRYSDLKVLNEQIQQKNNEFKLNLKLPRFPKKKILGRTKNSQNDIIARAQELQQYLEIILNIPALWSFEFLKDILPQQQLLDETCKLDQMDSEYSKAFYWLQMDELKKSFLQRQDLLQSMKKNKQKANNTTVYYQRYHFQTHDFSIENDYVKYFFVMNDTKKATKYKFETRYSSLRDFHQLLEKQQYKNNLPNFPKRKLIGQTIDDPLKIQERQQLLSKYLNDIFSVKEFGESEPLLYFITRIKLEGKSIKSNQAERITQFSQQVVGSSFNVSQGIDEIREQKSC